MKFLETELTGAYVLELEVISDDRGFFSRTFCREEFESHGLIPDVAQCNLSYNHRAGTLRGLHYQDAQAPESKLVRCTRGAICDVIVDLRPGSVTYLDHIAVELTAENRRALFVPPLFAHGYQALADESEVVYQVSQRYTPGAERGLRHDDPVLRIEWPLPVTAISQKDASWPLLDAAVAKKP